MKHAIMLFIAAASLFAQASVSPNKPSPFGLSADVRTEQAPRPASAQPDTTEDPYLGELNRALDSEKEWKRLDMGLTARLEGTTACGTEPTDLINSVAAARVKSLADFAEYYQKHKTRYQEVAMYATNTAADRGPDRSEIASTIATLRREKSDLTRREGSLRGALSAASQDTPEGRKTLAEIEGMIARKTSQIERSEKTLELFDHAQDYLKQRRELARIHLRELSELIDDERGEALLWESLYRGMLHEWQLRCDQATPSPTAFDGDYWRKRVGK
jgi:hypothetical protein